MRAREFTINIPITVSINGDDDPVISTGDDDTDADLQQNPVMISPQQQELELAKAALGKSSPVIDKITQDHTVGKEPPQRIDTLERIKALINR